MSYEEEEKRATEENNRRIDIDSNNPWAQIDIERHTKNVADHFVENHLKGSPDPMTSNTIKRELAAFYSMTDPTMQRYTIRRIVHHEHTYGAPTDLSKSDDYIVKYKRD